MSSWPSGRARGVLLLAAGALSSTVLVVIAALLTPYTPLAQLEVPLAYLVAPVLGALVFRRIDTCSLRRGDTPDTELQELAREFTGRNVQVGYCTGVTGPDTMSDTLIRLPRSLQHAPEAERMCVFAHELMHLSLRDNRWRLPLLVGGLPVIQHLLLAGVSLTGVGAAILVALLLPVLLSWTLELRADVEAVRLGVQMQWFEVSDYLARRKDHSAWGITHPPGTLRALAVRSL